MAAITVIGSGLRLVDSFVDLVRKRRGDEEQEHSGVATEENGEIRITEHGDEVRVAASELALSDWDQIRYDALEKRVKTNWGLYNGWSAELPALPTDEQVRIKVRMDATEEELCKDFKEMVHIYERALQRSLPDHYSLYDTCP